MICNLIILFSILHIHMQQPKLCLFVVDVASDRFSKPWTFIGVCRLFLHSLYFHTWNFPFTICFIQSGCQWMTSLFDTLNPTFVTSGAFEIFHLHYFANTRMSWLTNLVTLSQERDVIYERSPKRWMQKETRKKSMFGILSGFLNQNKIPVRMIQLLLFAVRTFSDLDFTISLVA